MSKTWETLFNLSSFMNYLLTKALPDEKLEAPLYVLDSLYDLLTVTSAWIDKIKSLSNDRPSLRNQISEHSAQAILSSRSNKNIEENTSQTNIRHNYSSERPSDSAPVPSCYSSKEGVRDNGVEGLESSSKDVSEVFMRLSKEMINGRPYGHYCRPCDSVIFSKKEWDIHMVDRLHTFLTEECEIKFACCAYCKLIIFASPRDANKLFKYHELEHHPQYHVNMPNKENTSKNETNKNPLKSRDDFVRNDSDVVSSRVSDIEVDHGFRTGQRISPFFIELDKKMHSGKEKGFYCYSCDKAFEVVTEWNHHFQETAVHSDQFDSSASFDMCDSCSLVIYAIPSILKWYKSHHMLGHYCHGGEKKHNIKSSVESLQSSVQGQDNPKSCKSTDSYQNTYKISQQFKDFNTKIHSYNLEGHYYCRPCNAALGPEEWIKHSQSRKHSELMASRKFKNWKGTCTYCSLTIIGTHDTVKYYMEFHSVLHNKIISYDFHKISSYSTPDNFTPIHPKRKQKERIRKTMVSRGSVSTLGDEGVSDFEEKDIDNSKTENSSNISDSVGESSWYASSREEQILNSIRQLIESRTKEKYTSGIPQFGALCTLCEYSTEDAFDWQDHMTSGEHCQRKTSHDKQAFFSDLNIYIFASMNLFEKYKSLVKGNWSFIEN